MIDPEENDHLFMIKYGEALSDLKPLVHKSCPEAEMLVRYFEKELGKRERQAIETHLDWCPVCVEVLRHLMESGHRQDVGEVMPENWSEIEAEISRRVSSTLGLHGLTQRASGADIPRQQRDSSPARKRRPQKAALNRRPQKVALEGRLPFTSGLRWGKSFPQVLGVPQPIRAYAGVAISLILAVLCAYAYFSRPAYFALAQIEPETPGTVRGEDITSQTLREGLSSFAQGDYQDAIRKLERHLSARPHHYAANYHLALAYLMAAKVRMLGLPYDFDSSKVRKGVEHLHQALEEAGDNAFYQEDCLWYLGKAYLMLGDWQKAKTCFEQLAELKQPNLMRKHAARKMILRLQEISPNL